MRDMLQDDLVSLRRLQVTDVSELFAAVTESWEHLQPWMPWCQHDYSIAHTEDYVSKQIQQWELGNEYSFVIRSHEHRLVGMCGLNQFNRIHHFANLGYWLRRDATGRGYATAATRLVADFGIQDLNLARIEILIDVENYRSQRVAERAEAVCEGILRSRLWLGDRAHDAVCYSYVR